MRPNRLRAPSTDGALLAAPPLEQAGAVLRANASRLSGWDYDFQGRRAYRLRMMARAQAVAQARFFHEAYGLDWPDVAPRPGLLVVTGHQPELFHPGVWVKNFAVAGLAEASRGVGLNLIVDNDIPKGPTIRVPSRDGAALRTTPVAYDVRGDDAPYEDRTVHDEKLFASFADRARATLDGAVEHPMLDPYWARVLRRRDRGIATDRVGLRFALARHELEAEWGVRNVEVPIGAICETEAFLWFACHLLAHLPRFRAIHNAALARYRAAYGIRSRHHPVPSLGRQGEWSEAPFWAWRSEAPRRHPLLIRALTHAMELRIGGEDRPFLEIPLAADRDACCAVEALQDLPGLGIRLRTRALTTTIFARYLLGDLFVHGIGGAKYDELGDELAREFFGIEPPTFLTISQTLWIGLEGDPATLDGLLDVNRGLRDLAFNPDRHLATPLPPEARPFVDAKWAAIEGPASSRRARLDRLRTIRHCNEALAPWVEAERGVLLGERSRLNAGLKNNAIARSREFAFPLHDQGRLGAALEATRRLAARA